MSPNLALDVLRGTPVWVFVLFFILLRLGLQQLTPTVRSLKRVLMVPLLFIAWGLLGLFNRAAPASEIATCWLTGAVVGALITTQLVVPMKIDRTRGLVRQAGSMVPVLRNMVLFLGHYLLHVAAAIHPQARDSLGTWDIALSGLGAGYFIAWGIGFARIYAAAPETDAGEVACARASIR